MFQRGQHVLCVNDAELTQLLTKGRVYTVREFRRIGDSERPGFVFVKDAVRLEEVNPGVWNGIEGAFDAARFRPLPDDRLAAFRKALERHPVGVPA